MLLKDLSPSSMQALALKHISGPSKLPKGSLLMLNKDTYYPVIFDGITKQISSFCLLQGGKNDEFKKVSDEERLELLEGLKKYVSNEWRKDRDIINDGFTTLSANGKFKFCIGSDPEIFVESKGKLIPAFEFLGSKEKTEVMSKDGSKVYWDGFQAEFEVIPDQCLQYHGDSVRHGLQAVLNAARAFDKNAKLSTKSVMDIPKELLDSSKREHVDFGCMPSYNAYGIKGLGTPGNQCLFRPAGGHMHFGIGKGVTGEEINRMVKALDATIGVAAVSLFAKYDDPRRRELYGLPGEYRLPPHGLEYRTLSNAWLLHPIAMHLVFDLARVALKKAFFTGIEDWKATEDEVVECIMTTDVALARKILKRNKDLIIQMLFQNYGGEYFDKNSAKKAEIAYEAFLGGIETLVENPDDIAGNWHLDRDTWQIHSDTKDGSGPGYLGAKIQKEINAAEEKRHAEAKAALKAVLAKAA